MTRDSFMLNGDGVVLEFACAAGAGAGAVLAVGCLVLRQAITVMRRIAATVMTVSLIVFVMLSLISPPSANRIFNNLSFSRLSQLVEHVPRKSVGKPYSTVVARGAATIIGHSNICELFGGLNRLVAFSA